MRVAYENPSPFTTVQTVCLSQAGYPPLFLVHDVLTPEQHDEAHAAIAEKDHSRCDPMRSPPGWIARLANSAAMAYRSAFEQAHSAQSAVCTELPYVWSHVTVNRNRWVRRHTDPLYGRAYAAQFVFRTDDAKGGEVCCPGLEDGCLEPPPGTVLLYDAGAVPHWTRRLTVGDGYRASVVFTLRPRARW